MQVIDQTLEEVVASLSPLDVDWMDDMAASAIAKLAALPKKAAYNRSDVAALLDGNFEEGILCARLFLALSKDNMETELRRLLSPGGIGVKRYRAEPEVFLDALESLGLLDAMTATVNHDLVWSDILVERLRSGRGSAISGQRRGRGVEDFAEALVKEVFGAAYETRCTFTGADGKSAKCDVAIPNRVRPRIVIEAKGYGATGSKMTDIIGDLDAIIDAKRHDTTLLFVTDGMTWNARLSDLKKIVERQNQGKIARIYTTKQGEQLLSDLKSLKQNMGL
ncbi:DpnII family type II restriction endonuclease [Methyloraptor flagellatus]|uniref:DpnII family type II restriction endonuclease n=1 Tax=Methyloraptor flagellatus TaxID=3162530 RepID=A0AAU7XGS3_9HYPH